MAESSSAPATALSSNFAASSTQCVARSKFRTPWSSAMSACPPIASASIYQPGNFGTARKELRWRPDIHGDMRTEVLARRVRHKCRDVVDRLLVDFGASGVVTNAAAATGH